jgi:hypothetical protein
MVMGGWKEDFQIWKFKISNEAKAKRKNVKPAALKGGATDGKGKKQARQNRGKLEEKCR